MDSIQKELQSSGEEEAANITKEDKIRIKELNKFLELNACQKYMIIDIFYLFI
jgi:hypothetical protein